jgi:hypothetical protein
MNYIYAFVMLLTLISSFVLLILGVEYSAQGHSTAPWLCFSGVIVLLTSGFISMSHFTE